MRPTYSDTNIQHRRGDVKQIGGKISGEVFFKDFKVLKVVKVLNPAFADYSSVVPR